MANFISKLISFYLLLLWFSPTVWGGPGRLLKIEKLDQVTEEHEIDWERLGGPLDKIPRPINGIIFYRLTYETVDLNGTPVRATGLLSVPNAGQGPFPLLSFQHGTEFKRTEVPSNLSMEGKSSGFIYAAQGYVVAAADYLGLGGSPGFHPYHHADSEAWVAADMLRATKQACLQLGIALSPELFLVGYSQGGHATMALHRYLEKKLSREFKVTASAPMDGAYDLSHTTLQTVLPNPERGTSAELAYILLSMNRIYHLFKSLREVFLSPFAGRVRSIFDGTNDYPDVFVDLPEDPQELLRPEFYKAILKNPSHPFVRALRANDVYRWRPNAPVRLIHAKGDHEVPFQNAVVAQKTMTELGATDVQIIKLGSYNHSEAYEHAHLAAFRWFQSVRRGFKQSGHAKGQTGWTKEISSCASLF